MEDPRPSTRSRASRRAGSRRPRSTAGWPLRLIGLTHAKQWVDAQSELVDIDMGEALESPDELLAKHPDSEFSHLGDDMPPDAVVFPVLHGPFGEDGVIQGHLEALGLPYVGAGVLSSAVCMDKGIARSVLHDNAIPVAAWRLAHRSTWSPEVMEEAIDALGLPLFVKPANLGSSIGVAKASEAAAVGDSVSSAFEFDDHVILEEFVRGRELELAVMGNEQVAISRAGEIIASREFYDYEDKYLLGKAETIAPDRPDPEPAGPRPPAGRGRLPGPAGRRAGPGRRLPARRRRDRGERGQHHAGLHADLHVPHALGSRGPPLRRRRRRAGRPGPGPP